MPTKTPSFKIAPVTPSRWRDLEELFGERGACGGCWCMWWRLARSLFQEQKGNGNRDALKKIVEDGEAPGLLAYCDGQPVGWCAISPRESYPRLERSRTLAPVDDKAVWSVTCFFVARPFRRKGLTVELLKAAVAFARKQGARMIEGYPIDPKKSSTPDVFAYPGLVSAFRKAGFKEVQRRSPTRPIMRRRIANH